MKKSFLLLMVIIPLMVVAQNKDTVHINRVHYVTTLINPKTNRIERYWVRSKKVKSGKITKVSSDWYKVNNKILEVCNIDSIKNSRS